MDFKVRGLEFKSRRVQNNEKKKKETGELDLGLGIGGLIGMGG